MNGGTLNSEARPSCEAAAKLQEQKEKTMYLAFRV